MSDQCFCSQWRGCFLHSAKPTVLVLPLIVTMYQWWWKQYGMHTSFCRSENSLYIDLAFARSSIFFSVLFTSNSQACQKNGGSIYLSLDLSWECIAPRRLSKFWLWGNHFTISRPISMLVSVSHSWPTGTNSNNRRGLALTSPKPGSLSPDGTFLNNWITYMY